MLTPLLFPLRLDLDALPFEANLLAFRPAVDPPTYLLSQLTVGETASSRSAADRYDFRTVLPQVEAQTGQGGSPFGKRLKCLLQAVARASAASRRRSHTTTRRSERTNAQ